ncbi:MAG TPA: glycosyltransferase family 39 protein [Tepidisphaeraceae bacterium]
MKTTADSTSRRWLLAILLLALILRLAWSLTRPTTESSLSALPDQREYLACARNLIHEHTLYFVDPRFNDPVYAFRTPGYPLFVAACGARLTTVRIAQSLLDTLTALGAYLLARRWLTPRACLFASAMCALNPFLFYFTGLILTEILFTSLLTWGLVLLVTRNGRYWIAGAAVLALSVLVRPGAIALPVVLSLLAAIANRHHPRPYHRWPLPVGATTLALTLLVLLPWSFRNYRVVGQWVWTSTNAGFTAFDGFNRDATGASDQRFVENMPQLRSMNEVSRSEYLAAAAKEFMRSSPGACARLMLVKLGRTWSPAPLSADFARPLYVAVALAFSLPVYFLILLGLAKGNLPISAKLFLLATAIYLSVGAMLSVGSLRYRIPAEAPLAVLAAAGADRIVRLFTEQLPFRRVTVSTIENSPPQ